MLINYLQNNLLSIMSAPYATDLEPHKKDNESYQTEETNRQTRRYTSWKKICAIT